MFTITIGRRDRSATSPVAAAPSAPSAPSVKRPRGAWRADPISPKQIGKLATMFRQLDLVTTVGETETVIFAGHTFTYDPKLDRGNGKTGGWTGMAGLTKGQASDMLDALFQIPASGFTTVTNGQAEDIAAAPQAAPKKKGDTITVDGVTYRIAGIAR